MRCLDSITDSMDMRLHTLQEIMKDRKACHVAIHGVAKSQTQQLNNNEQLISSNPSVMSAFSDSKENRRVLS